MPKIILLPLTSSTMHNAQSFIDADPLNTEHTIFIAKIQTDGKGRQGRQWLFETGNLAMTMCIPCDKFDPRISMVIGLATRDSIAAIAQNCDVKIKWPNDILADNKKISGILTQYHRSVYMIGIGINIVSHPPNINATSLKEFNNTCDPIVLAKHIYDKFMEYYAMYEKDAFEDIRSMWLQQAAYLNQTITTHHPITGKNIQGTFLDIDLHGSLVLGYRSSKIIKIHSSNIFAT